ncbi:MAG: branched-chain amino acid transporter AzlD [Clostridiaceae bacterium]|nr:branched-chain amino acid transporter AzlD [Clostridiaceae bacterium]
MQTKIQVFITIVLIALSTHLTRFLPFIIFSDESKVPNFVRFLGKYLPTASIALLVVYALKDVSLTTAPHGLPELITLIVITLVHMKWRKSYISIGVGTVLYMFLVQVIF